MAQDLGVSGPTPEEYTVEDYEKAIRDRTDELGRLLTREELSQMTSEMFPKLDIDVYDTMEMKIEMEELKILNVGIENNLLFYEIYLPLNLKINDNNILVLSIYDPSYYFTYFYDDDSVTSTDKSKILYTILQENKDMSYYFGNINPLEIEVMFN